MSTLTAYYFIWGRVYRVQVVPLLLQSPCRNRTSTVGGWGNAIRPTRCTEQGTSYCFTNLLLPQSLFFLFGDGGGWVVHTKIYWMSLQWELATNRLTVIRPGHLRPSVCRASAVHTLTGLAWSPFASGLQWPETFQWVGAQEYQTTEEIFQA